MAARRRIGVIPAWCGQRTEKSVEPRVGLLLKAAVRDRQKRVESCPLSSDSVLLGSGAVEHARKAHSPFAVTIFSMTLALWSTTRWE